METMSRKTLFIIQPFSEGSGEIYQLIREAAITADIVTIRSDNIVDVGANITDSIHQAIKEATLVIADVTNANPNVMYEIGVAQAANKPVILIANNSRSIPFDLAGVRVHIYEPHDYKGSLRRLGKLITQAINNPDDFSFDKITSDSANRPNVFISYSHEDNEYLDRLLVHLKPLEKDGLIDLWVDTRLRAGDKWKQEIDKALQRATVALLLVSADFLASDFITDNELPPILRNAEEMGTRIIPLIVKPCRFTRDKSLRNFQAVNNPKEALILLSDGDKERIYDEVAAEVERWLQKG